MKRHSRILLISLIAVGALLAVYAIAGFVIVPRIAQRQLAQLGSEALDRKVTVGRVQFNPFTFVATVHGAEIIGHKGERLAATDRARVIFNAMASLVRREWRFADRRSPATAGRWRSPHQWRARRRQRCKVRLMRSDRSSCRGAGDGRS